MTFMTLFTQLFLGLHAALTILALTIGGAAIGVFFYEYRNDRQRKNISRPHTNIDFTVFDE